MKNIRIIARLDIKGANLIKGIHLEGLRVLGDPNEFAKLYYEQGADELIYMDAVASLYGRNHLSQIISRTSEEIFIPLTVGGGIRSVEDAQSILRLGADKIAINTAAVKNPKLIYELARILGSQAVVLSVEAKNVGHQKWEVFIDNGREGTGIDVVDWVKLSTSNGCGEILLTSIDREGTKKGFDLDLVGAVTSEVRVPVIASGGMGSPRDISEVVKKSGADAIAIAGLFHYKISSIADVRAAAIASGLEVRNFKQV